jgi:hypothetical protein
MGFYLFYLFFLSFCIFFLFTIVMLWLSYRACILRLLVVMREPWYCCLLSNISFCHRRMLHHFRGYHLGCACGSWSDHLRVIGRNHFVNACPGSCHHCMRCWIVCCYRFDHMICLEVGEGRSDFAVFVFCIQLVLPFVHLSCFSI